MLDDGAVDVSIWAWLLREAIDNEIISHVNSDAVRQGGGVRDHTGRQRVLALPSKTIDATGAAHSHNYGGENACET
jgi:hypothetical protein